MAALYVANNLLFFQAPKMIQQRLSEIGDKTARVVVSIPTRKAVTSIAQRVSVELGTPLGSKVGYSIRGQKISSPKTNILFVTPGTLG